MKKKYEISEKFIGWKSEDGLLEVVGIHGKQGKITTFKVICHKCKEDKELFPDGYFVSYKSSLIIDQKPCGCSKNHRWTKDQYLVLAKRVAYGRFIVHGFDEIETNKFSCECTKHNHMWKVSIPNLIHNKTGCPLCAIDNTASNLRKTKQEVDETCITICNNYGYKFLGFPNGYKNKNSHFEYECPKHGIQNVRYGSVVFSGTKCYGCAKEEVRFNGYYPERKDEVDYLYVLDFDSKFIKIGRSFDIDERLLKLKSLSNIENIIKLRIFTATHQEIYDTEQALLEELRERGFQYHLNWTKECFENKCLYSLNKLLDICGLQELTIE